MGSTRFLAVAVLSFLITLNATGWAQTAKNQPKIPGGTTKTNPKDGLTYVWIPPGIFQMGCSPGDNECIDSEKPAHSVTITNGFWIGQTPVTQAAYQRVIGTNPSNFKGDQRPVEMVNWGEATAYCTAVGMRLPTEAEWEYAARARSTVARYGDLDPIAWYEKNSDNQSHEVGQKRPNAWKLFDMLGNVWEWTADWYDQNYYSQSPSQDPRGSSSGAEACCAAVLGAALPGTFAYRAASGVFPTFATAPMGSGVSGKLPLNLFNLILVDLGTGSV